MSNEDNYVLIIGSSNMDLNIYLERFPTSGETVTGGIFKQSLGGKGANQAVASKRAGANTIFIGKIGNDAFGDQMLSQLSSEGIDTTHVIRSSQEASGIAFIMIDKAGENMISVAPGANVKLNPSEIRANAEVIKRAKTIIVQMELPIATIAEIYNVAAQEDIIKILNPAPLKPIPLDVLNKIDILVPNEGELFRLHSLLGLKQLTGNRKEKIIHASKDITDLGVKCIITTLGSEGSLTFDREKDTFFEVPAFKVNAIDTVGAGDCFNGVLACKLCQGEKTLNAIKYATVAASIAVTRKGAQDSMPYLNEIEKKIKKLK